MKQIFAILFVTLLVTACGTANKELTGLEDHFNENGIMVEEITNEDQFGVYDQISKDAGIDGRMDYKLKFDNGSVWINVFDSDATNAKDKLRKAMSNHLALDEKTQINVNGNLLMIIGNGEIEAINAHSTEIIDVFKKF